MQKLSENQGVARGSRVTARYEVRLMTEANDRCRGHLVTRDMIAVTYADAILSEQPVDWEKVNTNIRRRWSLSGLKYIKKQAWKRARGW